MHLPGRHDDDEEGMTEEEYAAAHADDPDEAPDPLVEPDHPDRTPDEGGNRGAEA